MSGTTPDHAADGTPRADPDVPTVAELLAIARAAAAAGAAVLAERRGLHVNAATKSAAGDWVTEFDHRAEDAVRDVIRAARPDDEISGEEYGTSLPSNPTAYRWSIDPLDGTVNFVRGIAYYATSVAVAGPAPDAPSEVVWLAGVVQAPALGRTYWASRGGGAWLRDEQFVGDLPDEQMHDDGGPVPVGIRRLMGPDPDTDGRLIATGFGYDADRRQMQVSALNLLLPGFANIRRLGSAALDLCFVADGTLDAYAEYGTQEYDWAAGALVAEEAGCPVLRPRVEPGWSAVGDVDFDTLQRWTDHL
jgi:myo-inositol-1(or 4)-monophosphatase